MLYIHGWNDLFLWLVFSRSQGEPVKRKRSLAKINNTRNGKL